MGKKITTIILSLVALGAVFFYSAKIVYSQDSYRVNHGTSEQINAHGVCYTVENNSGKDIFIPVKTAEEWAEFIANPPLDISLLDCCGGDVTFTYKGSSVTYGTVESQGECWMDRNLGASRVATGIGDAQAYGDLFQWGRLDDGHQTRTSGKTTTLSSTDVPGHSNFIYGMGFPHDWRSPQNNNLWQGISGTNNPCPSGWRIPTITEWDTEQVSWSSNDAYGAFGSPLKLTGGGARAHVDASLHSVGPNGFYWSSTVDGMFVRYLRFWLDGFQMATHFRAHGLSVRCIQD